MDRRLDAADLARFKAGFGAHWPAAKLGLAVSGGPDSMAMLGLGHECLGAMVEVATVDHSLRPESAAECALVAEVCKQRGIACRTLKVSLAEGNVQDRARAARYDALGRWAAERGFGAIATAHHADDQAETLLMRLNRGSGLAGLAGIRPRTMIGNCPVPILRPLLRFRKTELRRIAEQGCLPFVQDPSNGDASFERVRVRRELEEADWLDPLALSRSAAHLAEAEAVLEAIAEDYWQAEASVAEDRIAVPVTRWNTVSSRLVARAITMLGTPLSHGEVAAFLESLGKRGNIAGVLVERISETYVCSPEPPRRTG